MENFSLKRDLVKAFAQAEVQVLTIVEQKWDDPTSGDCYTIRIQAEVIPVAQDLKKIAEAGGFKDDPSAPLTVRIWTNKAELLENEALKVYLKGNKPFFGRIIYQDASGMQLQLLPNPYRQEAYFQGGVVYDVPSGLDQFDMVVQAPFGRESVSVYASTAPWVISTRAVWVRCCKYKLRMSLKRPEGSKLSRGQLARAKALTR